MLGRAAAPVVRAGREGVSPTVAERRRLAVLAAVALAAAGWLVGGMMLAAVAGIAGPLAATAVVRARRRRFRAALTASAPVVARAFADALSAGHAVRGALDVVAAGIPAPPGRSSTPPLARCGSGHRPSFVLEHLRPAGRLAGLGRDGRRNPAATRRGGDLPALLRDLAHALEAAARQDRDAIPATAQARFTARIVLVLPIGAALVAELAQPGLLVGLFANPVSAWLTCFALMSKRPPSRASAASPGTWSGDARARPLAAPRRRVATASARRADFPR